VALSSLLFGLAMLIRAWRNCKHGNIRDLAGAGQLGFGSLVPVMMWHAGLDLAAGIAGTEIPAESTDFALDSGS